MDFGVSFYVATYAKTDDREWLPLWLDSTITSMSFTSPPSVDEVVQVLTTWTFDEIDERGTLLDERIYYQT
jgi:hypothetical protein